MGEKGRPPDPLQWTFVSVKVSLQKYYVRTGTLDSWPRWSLQLMSSVECRTCFAYNIACGINS